MGAAVLASLPADSFAQNILLPGAHAWNGGRLTHLLPTVSDTRILIKASFSKPLSGAPVLRVGSMRVQGRMTDTEGTFWQFYATDLQPGRKYSLSLQRLTVNPYANRGTFRHSRHPTCVPAIFALCFSPARAGPKTPVFSPPLSATASYAAAFVSAAGRIANGDHVYWDLHSPRVPLPPRQHELESFDRSALVFGDRTRPC